MRLTLLASLALMSALLLPARLAHAATVSGAWLTAPPLPAGRTGVATVTAQDGTIYAIGGNDNTQDISFRVWNTVFSFKPGTDTSWQTAPSLPAARTFMAATVGADGTIYAIGGFDNSLNYQSTVYTFKPGTDTSWHTAPSLPTAPGGLAATTGADGAIYVIGGALTGEDDEGEQITVAQRTVYSFKPGTDTSWHTAPSLPAGRAGVAAVTAADGTLYAIGGDDGNFTAFSTVYSFKPGTDTAWQSAPSLPDARTAFAATTGLDGTIYAIGGVNNAGTTERTVYSFKPGTDTSWQAAPSLPAVREDLGVTTGLDGSIYAIGGDVLNHVQSTVYRFVQDTTPPTASPTIVGGAAGAYGWYTSDVTVDWDWSDNAGGSGIDPANCATSSTSSGEGTITLTAGCTDLAGNTGHASYTVKVDKTAPTISASASTADGAPYTAGTWTNQAVTVRYTCSDASSGVASCPADQVFSTNGVTAQTSGTATDNAGNSASAAFGPIQVDTQAPSAPVASFSATPAYTDGAGHAWYKDSVTVSYSGSTDPSPGSGVDVTTYTSPQTFNRTGSFLYSGTVQDAVGNRSPATTGTVYVDASPPTVSFTACPASVLYGSAAGATWTAGDQGSGLAGASSGSLPLNTSSVGQHTVTAPVATDNVGHTSDMATCTYSVQPAPLTITADNQSVVYGQPLPPFTVTPHGLVNGDTLASLQGTLTVATTATQTSPPGTYTLTPGGLSSPNYSITFDPGTLTIAQDASTVALASAANPAPFGQPLTLTAKVSAAAPGGGTPTGTVTFLDSGTPIGTATLANGQASLTTATLLGGAHNISASYGGDADFTAGTAANLAQAIAFSRTISGIVNGPQTVQSGETVLVDGTVNGPLSVQAGGAAELAGAHVSGLLTASGAGAVALCGSTVNGPVSISGTSGFVRIGSDSDDPAASCAGNTLRGPLTLDGNKGGVEVEGNTVSGPLSLTNTSGTAPSEDNAAPEIEANTIGGPLSCSGNTPAPSADGQPNTVSGPKSGQCAVSGM